jgi:pimeloyl-ACP methyl ester carboxylesterase
LDDRAVFPNCGHWAMQERQADFERVVLEFLTRETDSQEEIR